MAAVIHPLTVADRAWFSRTGGAQPLNTKGRWLEYRLRNGDIFVNPADKLDWRLDPRHKSDFDVLAYRLAESELSADPGTACAENFEALRADDKIDFRHIEPADMFEMLGDEPPEVLTLPTTGPYASLARTLYAAFQQAATGKGKERHAVDDVAFEDQPMSTINRQLRSVDGFIYQAHKKSLEAKRLPDGRAQAELLGAINYLAGACIAYDSWAKKPA